MNFIDDIKFDPGLAGPEINLFPQVADIVHAGIGGGVNFNQIQQITGGNGPTNIAFVAGPSGNVFDPAVYGFGQQSRRGGFTSTARTGKQIGMRYPLGFERVDQCLGYVLLAHNFSKSLRAPFSV